MWGSRRRRGKQPELKASLSPRVALLEGSPGGGVPRHREMDTWGLCVFPRPPPRRLTHLRLLLPQARHEAGQEQGEKAGCPEQPGHGARRVRLGLAWPLIPGHRPSEVSSALSHLSSPRR